MATAVVCKYYIYWAQNRHTYPGKSAYKYLGTCKWTNRFLRNVTAKNILPANGMTMVKKNRDKMTISVNKAYFSDYQPTEVL